MRLTLHINLPCLYKNHRALPLLHGHNSLRINMIPFLICLACSVFVVRATDCNVTLGFSYYDYVLNASCLVSCGYPMSATLAFRDKDTKDEYDEIPGKYTWSSNVTVRGSFWGEPLECKVGQTDVICVAYIAVNVTIILRCLGENGVWPPFTGPFVTDLPEYLDFTVPPDLTDEPRRLGSGQRCRHYAALHLQHAKRNDSTPFSPSIRTSVVISASGLGLCAFLFFAVISVAYHRRQHRATVYFETETVRMI